MTNEEKIREILNCEGCKKVIALSGATCSSPCSNFKELLEFSVWKEQQIIEKSFNAMTIIYQHYGHIPEDCEEEFKNLIMEK